MIKAKLYTAISFFTLLLSLSPLQSQYSSFSRHTRLDINPDIILPNAYAHNDYWHKRPLFDALDDGFTCVEADIYLWDNRLIVSHILPQLNMHKNLEKLYLKPLADYILSSKERRYKYSTYPITLMIDIKSDAERTFMALEKLLQKYRFLFSSYSNGKFVSRYVTVVITGNKPCELIKSRDQFIFIDEDLRNVGKDPAPDVYLIASCCYRNILSWDGRGPIPASEESRLIYYVKKAHDSGRKVRLWASPENKAVWRELLQCHVDLINTDELIKLRDFLIFDAKLYTKTGLPGSRQNAVAYEKN